MGGGPALLTQESVEKELKLSDDQVKQARELAEQQRGSFRGLRDLSPEERQKRVDERIRHTVESLSPLAGIEKEVRALSQRLADLEKKLED